MNASNEESFGIPVDFSKYESPDERLDASESRGVPQSAFESPKFLDYLSDIAIHGQKGAIKGLGTIGDLAEMLHFQRGDLSPEQEKIYDKEREVLAKMHQPGYKPSMADFMALTEDIDIPPSFRLPTSKNIETVTAALGFPEKPLTAPGRYAERIAQTATGAASTGGIGGLAGLGATTGAAAIGQTLEELGAPPWAQAAAEIATVIGTHRGSKKSISSRNKEVQEKLDELTNLGFSDQDLTLAKNALEKRGILKFFSKDTSGAQKSFKENMASMEQLFNKQLSKAFPGVEKGLSHLKEEAAQFFKNVFKGAEGINVKGPNPFTGAIDEITSVIKRTLANPADEKMALELLAKAKKNALNKENPLDFYLSFYQDLNRIGNWVNPRTKEHIFSLAKEGIKDTLQKTSPEMAKKFEIANKQWRRFKQAEDVSEILSKGFTDDGMNFKKMASIFDNPAYSDLLKNSLGISQYNNMKKISQIGEKIGNLKTAIVGGIGKENISRGKTMGLIASLSSLEPINILKTIGLLASSEAVQNLSTKLLTDPKYQALTLKLLEAIKNRSPHIATKIAEAYKKKIEKDFKK